ncbi:MULTISPECIES: M17 family metallopeptidase [unclassified Ruegeria]|uniref:leucyl aminopeptidase family protein n=1 Tax=unclassified Ruegeria TaxID=2625375 RepID=UPI001489789A|nr:MULTISPECIES: leucyl aminopeptidase family protein [unclassified Ruegeria]NOD76147.1 leucyl aminopeptidase family protein [Ruegeria sp. HKCCD4332]
MTLSFAASSDTSIPLHVIPQPDLEAWLQEQTQHVQSWVAVNGFSAALGQTLLVPDATGTAEMALAGYGTDEKRARKRFPLAAAALSLPEGVYHIASGLPSDRLEIECFGWLMSGYAFDRYASQSGGSAALVAPDGVDAARIEAMAQAEAFTRDLVNTPASDMGPEQLQQAAEALAGEFGAACNVTLGDTLLDQNFPMIHTVGRAAEQAPRLIELNWGSSGPKLTLVGKGVCFDTGGLNLKPGASMGLMKKDMGGAANVLGLARMIMALNLPVQLRVLIPAVENAVAGNAFRPGDILTSRKGLTVEINNTDAEGRLVLADALTFADEGEPDLVISMATLTGAARVAVGPDLAPFYTDDETCVSALSQSAKASADPVWRMPFHAPYEAMIEPGIADLDNAPSGGFAGSITAALFLRRFVGSRRYVHFDIYAWQPSKEPGRSKGGLGQGPRAILNALPEMLGL